MGTSQRPKIKSVEAISRTYVEGNLVNKHHIRLSVDPQVEILWTGITVNDWCHQLLGLGTGKLDTSAQTHVNNVHILRSEIARLA